MRRRPARRPSAVFAAGVVSALAACGGMVVVDQAGGGGAGSSVSSTSVSTGPAVDAGPDAPLDAGNDALSACEDPATCSRLIDHDGACLGAASAGDFCDFLATPCSSAPPDCAAIAAALGVDAHLASCGDGTSECALDWVGTVSDATLEALCAARAASGQPVDCILD